MKFPNVPSSVGLTLVLVAALGGCALAAETTAEKVLFEDNFTDKPGEGWSWLREKPGRWKVDKERREILIQPVWSQGNLVNLLLRPLPDVKEGTIAIEAHVELAANDEYEYAGLILYFDDDNFVAIRKGPHGDDGKIVSLVRRNAGKGDGPPSAPKNVIYNDNAIDLRMVVTSTKVQGWFRATSKDPWQSIGEQELPANGPARVGLRTGNGGDKPSWARFSRFRIVREEKP